MLHKAIVALFIVLHSAGKVIHMVDHLIPYLCVHTFTGSALLPLIGIALPPFGGFAFLWVPLDVLLEHPDVFFTAFGQFFLIPRPC
jgi:hypothetical protein